MHMATGQGGRLFVDFLKINISLSIAKFAKWEDFSTQLSLLYQPKRIVAVITEPILVIIIK